MRCKQVAASRTSCWVALALTPCQAPSHGFAAVPSRQRVKSQRSAVRRDFAAPLFTLLAIPLQKCRPLRSRHLFRGRAERRDSGLRCTPATHSPNKVSRSCTPRLFVSGLDAPEGSLSALRLRLFAPSFRSPAVSLRLPAATGCASTPTKSLPPPARPHAGNLVGVCFFDVIVQQAPE